MRSRVHHHLGGWPRTRQGVGFVGHRVTRPVPAVVPAPRHPDSTSAADVPAERGQRPPARRTGVVRAFNPRAVEWQRMHAVAAVFHLQHGHLDPGDKAKHGDLISWLTRQRHLNGQGLLDPARISELDALGMICSKNANAWERGYAYAAAFRHQHGHLAIPATAKLDRLCRGRVDAPSAQGRQPHRRPEREAGRAGRAVAPGAGLEPLPPPPARLPQRRRSPRRPGEPHRPRRRPDVPARNLAEW
ncbi:helicase associated domain-containing protein [Kitasatospora sp. NPDC059648]|uniref:helicase associated domain-containing protein n=1 Tax=Kitasatospora sp. NPDC059648 TaxID=3346894 RepID=UPI0036C5A4B1